MCNRYFIHTPDKPQSQRWASLLSILENVLPVKFSCSREGQSQFSGELVSGSPAGKACWDAADVSSLSLPPVTNASSEGELIELAVRFSDDPGVPFPFRGRSIRTKVCGEPRTLSLNPEEQPLAMCEFGPVWVVSKGRAANHFRSAFSPPVLSADGSLKDVLNGQRFLEMLPLLHWLRGICARTIDCAPSLRACFMFDDPNLHWPRYGFVDYRQLAERAEKENYHVSFATIPLDTWFTHRGTAEIFRNEETRLSLLVHGNNHNKRELAQPYTVSERVCLLRQAVQRIERLERRSGLSVSRVMVPPHGACSEHMLAALPVCGFEAACISHGSLRAHNKTSAWTKTLGYRPFENVRGCPVLPRWGVTGDLKNTILLAAYLNQAIILRGHHQDLKDGPELLDDLAGFVNGLGSVEWMNMTDMVRANRPASSVDAQDAPKGSTASKTQAKPSASVWFLRRLLTEGRDRLLSTRR